MAKLVKSPWSTLKWSLMVQLLGLWAQKQLLTLQRRQTILNVFCFYGKALLPYLILCNKKRMSRRIVLLRESNGLVLCLLRRVCLSPSSCQASFTPPFDSQYFSRFIFWHCICTFFLWRTLEEIPVFGELLCHSSPEKPYIAQNITQLKLWLSIHPQGSMLLCRMPLNHRHSLDHWMYEGILSLPKPLVLLGNHCITSRETLFPTPERAFFCSEVWKQWSGTVIHPHTS